eukprot:scaffold47223_cov39-Prasinocladus_malaysianus.AAC.1
MEAAVENVRHSSVQRLNASICCLLLMRLLSDTIYAKTMKQNLWVMGNLQVDQEFRSLLERWREVGALQALRPKI